MKRKIQISISVISMLAFSAMAQDRPYRPTDQPDYRSQYWHHPPPNRLNDAAKATDVIGMTVRNHRDRHIGKVGDLVVDVESGRIIQVQLSPVTQPGRGAAVLAVAPEDLHYDAAQKNLQLDANRERSDESPFNSSRSGRFEKVIQLMGTWVKNPQDERLGKVENILVDLPSGRIVAVIVSSRGFRMQDRELSAVPPTALRFNHEQNILLLDASREAFRRRPHFRADQWPDFRQSHYASEVYRAYQVEPYFSVEFNSANARERREASFVQNNTQADANTSAQIRNTIFADRRLSPHARNVKIITINGRVSLYGAVNTTEEKRLIGEIADRIAPVGNVDNQLEVTLAPTGRD